MSDAPSLPAPYDPLHLAEVDSVRDELARRAAAGADEGLLVWVDRQTAPRARPGHAWQATPGDLACGVLLRPEFDREAAGQISLVASLALGQTLAELAPPMVALHYRWPNDVLLAGGKVGAVWLDAPPPGAVFDWLGVSFAVNVAGSPEDEYMRFSTSLREQQAEGADAVAVLTLLSRYFLAGLNRWAEDGMAAVARAWRARQLDMDDELEVALAGEVLRGRPVVDDDGALRLAVDGGERRVTPAAFHGLVGPRA